jgi:hypothetical protein
VCGAIGFFLVPLLAPIAAIVLGHAARYRIGRSDGSLGGGAAAVAGLVLGYAGLAIQVLGLTFAILLFVRSDRSLNSSLATACNDEASTLQAAVRSAAEAGEGSRPADFLDSPLRFFELDGSRSSATLDDVSEVVCAAVRI